MTDIRRFDIKKKIEEITTIVSEIGEATCNHHEHEHHEGQDCSHGGKCHG